MPSSRRWTQNSLNGIFVDILSYNAFLISVFFLYIMVPEFVFMGSTCVCVGGVLSFFFFF